MKAYKYARIPVGLLLAGTAARSQQCTTASDNSSIYMQLYCQEIDWNLFVTISADNGNSASFSEGIGYAQSACTTQGYLDCQGNSQQPKEYQGTKDFTSYPDGGGDNMVFYWTFTDQHVHLINCLTPTGGNGEDLFQSPVTRQYGYYEAMCN
jgi:hypothetical protein